MNEDFEISRGLKDHSQGAESYLLLHYHSYRAVEQRDDKRPQLSDLRESGSIEQDADVVMFCVS